MNQIALTGGIAEGKSTVLGYLREAGYSIESADQIARTVFDTDEVQAKIADLLGAPRPVPREALRAALDDSSIRRAVNAITHPLIRAALAASLADFVEIPLLIETCLQGAYRRVWVVTCGPEEQLRRLTARVGSEGAAKALIGTQLTSRTKMQFADRVIRTNQEELSVQRFVTLVAQQDLC